MTKTEIKAAIRQGHATPGVDRTLFESCLEETIREDHPEYVIKNLSESRTRTGADGLPEGIHDRVAAMFSNARPAFETPSQRLLREASDRPVSDMKDDSRFDRPRSDPNAPQPKYMSDFGAILRHQVETYLAHPEPAPPKPKPVITTLRESFSDLRKRYPDAPDASLAAVLLFG